MAKSKGRRPLYVAVALVIGVIGASASVSDKFDISQDDLLVSVERARPSAGLGVTSLAVTGRRLSHARRLCG